MTRRHIELVWLLLWAGCLIGSTWKPGLFTLSWVFLVGYVLT